MIFTSEVVNDFVNDLSEELINIMKDLENDKSSFDKMGITFEEKAFYDILKMQIYTWKGRITHEHISERVY